MRIGFGSQSVRNFFANRKAAGLKLLLGAVALLLGATAGHSQWLETKIALPDTLGGATGPTCLTTDTSDRFVYIGDQSGAVYVVDAEARSRVAKLPCGYVYAICTNTRRNKVYAADTARNQIIVISCLTNQVVATIHTGIYPLALCYNSTDDKIYAANYGSDDITVIDCSSDSVIRTIRTGEEPVSLCYNPASNRVFCATELHGEVNNSLTVIDGANDSVVAVYAGAWYGTLVVNAVVNRVYVGSRGVGLFAVHGSTGDVLDTISGATWVCLNSRTQKLYTYDEQVKEVRVFDCAADTLVKKFRLSGQVYMFSVACDTTAGKVYVSCRWNGDEIVVIDGVSDTICARMPGPNVGTLLASSKRSRMYSTDHQGPELAVFDTSNDILLRTIMIGGTARAMCYDSIDDKVYYVTYSVLGEVGAIDAATNQPVGHVQVGTAPRSIVWHAPTNRVYCSGVNLTVIDPTADTVTKVLPGMYGLLCSAPSVNKVYAYAYADDELAVIDCRYDSVTKTIPIPTYDAWSMCFVAYDKLYVGGDGAVSIIDCVADTLIRSYPFELSRCVSGRDGKRVYCWRPSALCTFDPAGDSIVADVPWGAAGGWDLLYAPNVNKVYCPCPAGGEECVFVADGTTDSVIAVVPLQWPVALGYDSANGLVYCGQAQDSAVTFIDSHTDSVVGTLNVDLCANEFVPVPAHSRVYVGGGGNSSMPVIRTDPPGVEDAMSNEARATKPGPTVVKRVLVLNELGTRSELPGRNSALSRGALLDVSGRKVMNLTPGANDVRALAPGVYFIRQGLGTRGEGPGETRKIVLTE